MDSGRSPKTFERIFSHNSSYVEYLPERLVLRAQEYLTDGATLRLFYLYEFRATSFPA